MNIQQRTIKQKIHIILMTPRPVVAVENQVTSAKKKAPIQLARKTFLLIIILTSATRQHFSTTRQQRHRLGATTRTVSNDN